MKKTILSLLTITALSLGAKAQTTVSSNPNVNIPDDNTSGVTDVINISETNTIADINVNVTVQHSYVGDVKIVLTSPSGTNATLVDRIGVPASTYGCSLNDIIAEFDDDASSQIESACPPNGTYIPQNSLSIFDGENLAGNWTLRVSDNESTATGVFIDWSITYITPPNAFDTIYVNQNATGANNGTSWTNAYTEFANALTSPSLGDGHHVWVAAGTYYPMYDRYEDVDPGDYRTKEFFLMEKELSIYGGFDGTESDIAQRVLGQNVTILSGDLGALGDESDNSYTVFRALSSSFVLDGFTVSDGFANGLGTAPEEQKSGAGITVRNDLTNSATIKNCIIKNNKAKNDAGLSCQIIDGLSDVIVENTRFTENVSRWCPSFAMFVTAGTLNTTFVNCLIDNNATDQVNSEAGNTFSGGRFIRYQGGVVNGKVINCTFTQNTESNSAVADADRAVFGIQGVDNNTEIYNTIFYNNDVNATEVSIGFGASAAYTPASVSVYNTISEDDMGALSYVTATNNTQVNPLFVDPSTDDYSLQSSSPAINSGSTSGITALIPTTDLIGGMREIGTIDLGCYEYQTAVGLTDYASDNLTIYPNPTNGLVYTSLKFEEAQVYDVLGKMVQQFSASSEFDMTSFTTGVYLVKFKTADGVIAKRILKK